MKPTRLHALFAAVCLVWGTTWIAIKVGIAAVPPVFFVGTRFVVAGAILLGVLRCRGPLERIARADWPRLAAVTLLLIAVTHAFMFWGAQFVSSGLAAILDLAFVPVALLVTGALLGEERFSRMRAAGVALGVTGILVLFGPQALAGDGPGKDAGTAMWLAGGAAIVVAAFIAGFGAVLARPLLRAYPSVLVSGVITLAGGVVLSAAALVVEPGATAALSGRWGGAVWASWGFLVLFGSVVAWPAYLRLVREWGPSRAGSFAFVSPAIAVLLGVLVFGEAVTATDALGMAVMLAGAWLTLRPAEPAPAALRAIARPVRPEEAPYAS